MNVLLVAIGGAVGSVCRYGAGLLAVRLLGPDYPFGTLAVNILGSFLMGVVVALLARRGVQGDAARLLIATGFLGGFTTFSTFSLDAVALWQRGEGVSALVYVLASVFAGVIALFAGLALVRQLAG